MSPDGQTHVVTAEPQSLDLRGVPCPLNWVRTRLALEAMTPGGELRVELDPGESRDSVVQSAREDRHDVEAPPDGSVRIVKR